jgi:hypothetical protein
MKKVIACSLLLLAVLGQDMAKKEKAVENYHLKSISRLSKVLNNKVKAQEAT